MAANLPLYLTLQEMEVPSKVIVQFFHSLTLDEARELVGFVFDSAVGLPDEHFEGQRGLSRTDFQFLGKEVVRLIEAAFLLSKDQRNKR
ncbi:hypothetical protein [Dinghuibacter silviterrae]|uniref:Uncharacterized protein n=1 Tax=Dinghuibacter silviterrae TaxID=1539049 RepID=A0A4R8DRG9_9BACT|nr:hypothetical protein [Dinghuibacter silviterrae]TDW99730.1 hypothetical protein EDB95_0741 [Dinghuibacter silviterrae]